MARIGDYTVPTDVMVPRRFATAAARTSGLPSPALNELSVLDTAVGNVEFWNGSAWQSISTASGGTVASVDGKAGVVSLAADYVNVTGDTMTGALTAPYLNLNASVRDTVVLTAKVAGVTNLELRASTSGIGIGVGALAAANGAAASNVAVGGNALAAASSAAIGCVAVGYSALQSMNTTGGVGVGYQAGMLATSVGTYVGYQAGKAVTTGAGNTMVGYLSGIVATGNNNTFIGQETGKVATTADNNTLVGFQAGIAMTGGNNTAVGYLAGNTITTGTNNTLVGGAASTLTTGSNNTIVGYTAVCGATDSNSVVIGSGAKTAASNATAIGAGTQANAAGAVAIGRDNAGNAAITAVVNEIKLGVTNHTVNIPGPSIVFSTTTGTTIGATALQKLSFWGATPVAQPAGWSVTPGYTAVKTFNPETATLLDVARMLGTFIDQVAKATGWAGA